MALRVILSGANSSTQRTTRWTSKLTIDNKPMLGSSSLNERVKLIADTSLPTTHPRNYLASKVSVYAKRPPDRSWTRAIEPQNTKNPKLILQKNLQLMLSLLEQIATVLWPTRVPEGCNAQAAAHASPTSSRTPAQASHEQVGVKWVVSG